MINKKLMIVLIFFGVATMWQAAKMLVTSYFNPKVKDITITKFLKDSANGKVWLNITGGELRWKAAVYSSYSSSKIKKPQDVQYIYVPYFQKDQSDVTINILVKFNDPLLAMLFTDRNKLTKEQYDSLRKKYMKLNSVHGVIDHLRAKQRASMFKAYHTLDKNFIILEYGRSPESTSLAYFLILTSLMILGYVYRKTYYPSQA